MAGAPDRGYLNRNDEHYQPYQPSSQPYHDRRDVSPIEAENPQFPQPGQHMSPPPPPPAHRNPVGMHPDSQYSQMQGQRQYGTQNYSDFSTSGITPGADNLGESSAGGGINGIAIGVANMNERESGAQALRDINGWGRNGDGNLAGPRGVPIERNPSETPFSDHYAYENSSRSIHEQPSHGSSPPYASGAIAPAGMMASSNNSERSIPFDGRPTPPQAGYPYQDNPYNRYSSSNLNLAPHMGAINPNEADDDDDWGMGPRPTTQQKRRSFIPFGGSHNGSREGTPAATATAAAAIGTGAVAGAGATAAARDASGNYNAVPGGSAEAPELANEKSEWLSSQNHGNKRLKWIVGTILVLVIIGAVVGGVLGAVLNKNKKSGSGGGSSGGSGGGGGGVSVEQDNKNVLTIDSDEIKELMNNKALHKVFPGIDYTPLNAQYPDCLHDPPSQNNITRDMAVISQLTNAVRLYGTDCNQTEMVLESIKRLKLEDDMKVWLGVWLGNNETTNDRQVDQMYKILDAHKADPFKGIIVGNEVLFRKDLSETELLKFITDIKDELDQKGIKNLPIATSDLGDNWTAEMATKVDIVMSNVHPFFAGIEASGAAGWTWDFWTGHDVILTKNDPNIKQIISEVGWPSAGGNNCGENTCATDKDGSVASIDNMNTFMGDWICQSLTNGTEYFW